MKTLNREHEPRRAERRDVKCIVLRALLETLHRFKWNAEQHLRTNSSWSFVWGGAISHFSSVIYVERMLSGFSVLPHDPYFEPYAKAVQVYSSHTDAFFRFSLQLGINLSLLSLHLSARTHWNHLVRPFSHVMWISNCFTIVLHYLLGHTIYDLAFVYPYNAACIAWECDECEMNVSMTRSLYSRSGFHLRNACNVCVRWRQRHQQRDEATLQKLIPWAKHKKSFSKFRTRSFHILFVYLYVFVCACTLGKYVRSNRKLL